MVMLLSVAIVKGFQQEIRNKVIGFGAHIQITGFGSNNFNELDPILAQQEFLADLEDHPAVANIQRFVQKQAILETQTEIEGVSLKGVGPDYDWHFFEPHLEAGQLPQLTGDTLAYDLLISRYMASRMGLDVGERTTVYFAQEGSNFRQRNFKVCGIYSTGLEELDKKFLFTDLRALQRINNWGLNAQIRFVGCTPDGKAQLEGIAFGGRDVYRYTWINRSWEGPGPHSLCPVAGDTLSLVVSDKWGTQPDTTSLVFGSLPNSCVCTDSLQFTLINTTGSADQYITGFEVNLKRYEDLLNAENLVFDLVGYDLKITSVYEQNPEIFNWLDMLDINVIILLTLMVVVATVNMTSALLILILERTQMIGILKALGASNWTIRKVFLYQAAWLIVWGLLLGNVLGLALCWVQTETGFLKLDPANYYVSRVPVLLEWWPIALINLGTLIICLLVLVLPTRVVTRISPVRAIRFD